MCSQDFNNWWLWCNKIPDTLQRVPFGNAGVVCWKLYSCEAGSSFELLEPPCCCKPTAAKHWFAGKTYFSIALRGEKENKSLFSPCSLISFFHEGKWNSDYSLWSCVLGFCLKCFFFKLEHISCECFPFLFGLLSVLQIVFADNGAAHHYDYTKCQEGSSTFQRDGLFILSKN